MNVDSYVAVLRTIFDANDPSDGIDRHDGFGSDVRVTSLTPVDDGDFPELEVTYELGLPRRPRFRRVPRTAVTRVLLAPEWLAASGYASPSAYAPEVARQVELAAVQHVDEIVSGRRRPRIDPDEVARSMPPADELWAVMLADLRRDHVTAEEVSAGVVELAAEWFEGDGTIRVHVTPEQWRQVVVDCEVAARLDSGIDASSAGDGPGLAWLALHEEIGSVDGLERHVVHFRRGFHRSVRAELPPVRDSNPFVAPEEGGGWLALGPDRDG